MVHFVSVRKFALELRFPHDRFHPLFFKVSFYAANEVTGCAREEKLCVGNEHLKS